jgi:hypothetical protein
VVEQRANNGRVFPAVQPQDQAGVVAWTGGVGDCGKAGVGAKRRTRNMDSRRRASARIAKPSSTPPPDLAHLMCEGDLCPPSGPLRTVRCNALDVTDYIAPSRISRTLPVPPSGSLRVQ